MRHGQRTAWPRTSWAHLGPSILDLASRAVLPASRTLQERAQPWRRPITLSARAPAQLVAMTSLAGGSTGPGAPLQAAVAGTRHFHLAKHRKYHPPLPTRSLASLRALCSRSGVMGSGWRDAWLVLRDGFSGKSVAGRGADPRCLMACSDGPGCRPPPCRCLSIQCLNTVTFQNIWLFMSVR